DLRHRVRELAVALLAAATRRGQLRSPQQLRLAPQLLGLLMQVDEDGDLRAQQLGVERLEDVVDRAARVAAEDVLRVLADGGEKDDGDVLRPLALLDERCGLEAVQLRHLHVQEDEREVVLEKSRERLLARGGLYEIAAERLEHGLEGEQVL